MQVGRQTDRHTGMQASKQAVIQAGTHSCKQKNRQENSHKVYMQEVITVSSHTVMLIERGSHIARQE